MIGFEREQEAIVWARDVIGIEGLPGFCRAMSIVNADDSFRTVVVMSNFSSGNVDVHIATERDKPIPKTFPQLFRAVFEYIFRKLNATRVTALMRAANTAARDFVAHLGFTHEGTMRQAFDGDDLCIYGFLKDEYFSHKWARS